MRREKLVRSDFAESYKLVQLGHVKLSYFFVSGVRENRLT
jgi:hypothetical protein